MIKFYEKRWIFFGISIALLLFSFIMIFVNGINLDIQFKGGAIIKYSYTGTIDQDKLVSIASSTLGRSVDTQVTQDLLTDNQTVVLNLAGEEGLSAQQQDALDNALKAEFKDNNLNLYESFTVEPFIGRRFLSNGILAIILASILIVLYVWYRFKKISGLSAGVMALVALFHDVLMVFATFIVFKIPINDAFIAVALTIIGYSINDTIVIYDRIRENNRLYKKIEFSELVNTSITQTMSRSINTSLATFVSVLLVYVFATIYSIESVQHFALPLLIGIVSGCYSTICIAGPLWVMWQNHKRKVRQAAKA